MAHQLKVVGNTSIQSEKKKQRNKNVVWEQLSGMLASKKFSHASPHKISRPPSQGSGELGTPSPLDHSQNPVKIGWPEVEVQNFPFLRLLSGFQPLASPYPPCPFNSQSVAVKKKERNKEKRVRNKNLLSFKATYSPTQVHSKLMMAASPHSALYWTTKHFNESIYHLLAKGLLFIEFHRFTESLGANHSRGRWRWQRLRPGCGKLRV